MCIVLHLLELVIQPPARYPDLFPVLNVLVSAPVFGLVWLWSIKSGIEVGWAVAGLGGGNPGNAHTGTTSHPILPSSTTNVTIASPKKPHPHTVRRGDSGSPSSARDPPLRPSSSLNRRIGSPPAILGPHKSGVRERTWSSASTNSNMRVRGSMPVGVGWDRRFNLDRTERVEGGEDQVLGLGSGSGGQKEDPSGRKRSRVQSLGVLYTGVGVQNRPTNVGGLPPPSD